MKDSEKKFRDYLTKGLESEWAQEDIKGGFRKLIGYLDDETEDETYPLFFATIEHFATGEGQTMIFVASRSDNEGNFIRYVIEKTNWYHAIGIDLSRKIEDLPQNIVDSLITPRMKKSLIEEAGADDQHSGRIEVLASYYANYS